MRTDLAPRSYPVRLLWHLWRRNRPRLLWKSLPTLQVAVVAKHHRNRPSHRLISSGFWISLRQEVQSLLQNTSKGAFGA